MDQINIAVTASRRLTDEEVLKRASVKVFGAHKSLNTLTSKEWGVLYDWCVDRGFSCLAEEALRLC